MKKIIFLFFVLSIFTFPQVVQRDTLSFANKEAFEEYLSKIGLNETQVNLLWDYVGNINQNNTNLQNEFAIRDARLDALELVVDSIKASIGIITPTFPSVPTDLVATAGASNISLIWKKYTISPVPDSFQVSIFGSDPSISGGIGVTFVYTTDTTFVHAGVQKNKTYWYYVKAIKNNNFSNASNIANAFVEDEPIVENRKYAHPTGLGNRSGVDSANAFLYTSMTGLVPGDVVVFLGGNYTSRFTNPTSGNPNGLITYKSSYYRGAKFTGTTGKAIEFNSKQYIRFLGFEFRNLNGAFELDGGNNVIYIDSCYIHKLNDRGIMINGSSATGISSVDSVWIRWNVIKNDSMESTVQNDCVYAQYGQNIFILKNILEQNNTIGLGHNDCIQTYRTGTFVVVGNKLMNNNSNNAQGMMLNTPQSGYSILYNNIIWTAGGSGKTVDDYWFPGYSGGHSIVIHNTFFKNEFNNELFPGTTYAGGDSNRVFKNNILYNKNYRSGNIASTIILLNGIKGDSVNYNLYFKNPSTTLAYNYNNSSFMNFTNWKTFRTNLDANSIESDPLFTSETNSYTGLTLQSGSPGKNAGTNLESYVSYLNSLFPNCYFEWKTIDGTNRDASPDMGGY